MSFLESTSGEAPHSGAAMESTAFGTTTTTGLSYNKYGSRVLPPFCPAPILAPTSTANVNMNVNMNMNRNRNMNLLSSPVSVRAAGTITGTSTSTSTAGTPSSAVAMKAMNTNNNMNMCDSDLLTLSQADRVMESAGLLSQSNQTTFPSPGPRSGPGSNSNCVSSSKAGRFIGDTSINTSVGIGISNIISSTSTSAVNTPSSTTSKKHPALPSVLCQESVQEYDTALSLQHSFIESSSYERQQQREIRRTARLTLLRTITSTTVDDLVLWPEMGPKSPLLPRPIGTGSSALMVEEAYNKLGVWGVCAPAFTVILGDLERDLSVSVSVSVLNPNNNNNNSNNFTTATAVKGSVNKKNQQNQQHQQNQQKQNNAQVKQELHKWLLSQLRWVCWTLACHERTLPEEYLGVLLTREKVQKCLLVRRWLYMGQLHQIQKIHEIQQIQKLQEGGSKKTSDDVAAHTYKHTAMADLDIDIDIDIDITQRVLHSSATRHFSKRGSMSPLQVSLRFRGVRDL